MVESLNYLLGRDKMIKDFKFFHGHTNGHFVIGTNNNRELFRVEDGTTTVNTNTENELIRILSEEMSRVIDDEIIETLTRRINGGGNQGFEGPIQRFSDNSDYFNRWMGIGGQTA